MLLVHRDWLRGAGSKPLVSRLTGFRECVRSAFLSNVYNDLVGRCFGILLWGLMRPLKETKDAINATNNTMMEGVLC